MSPITIFFITIMGRIDDDWSVVLAKWKNFSCLFLSFIFNVCLHS